MPGAQRPQRPLIPTSSSSLLTQVPAHVHRRHLAQPYPSAAQNLQLLPPPTWTSSGSTRVLGLPILPKYQCMCRARPWPSQVQNPKLQTGALRRLLQQPPHRGHPSRFPPPAGIPTHAVQAHTQNLRPGPGPSASPGHCASSRS